MSVSALLAGLLRSGSGAGLSLTRMSINRVVAILTPLVFAPVAAAATGWLLKHFPGLPTLDPAEVVALEIAAFTGAVASGLKWLHGQSQWERIEKNAELYLKQIKVDSLPNVTSDGS